MQKKIGRSANFIITDVEKKLGTQYSIDTISIFQENLETGSKASASQKKNAGDYFETDLKYNFFMV